MSLPQEQIPLNYLRIVKKICPWSLLVLANILGRKFLIRRCGGVNNALGFNREVSKTSKPPCHIIWVVLYWMGPLFNALITVLFMYILDSEKQIVRQFIQLTQKKYKHAIASLYTVFSFDTLKELKLKLDGFINNISQSIGDCFEIKTLFVLLIVFFILNFIMELKRSPN
ncbi:hypothetical protein, no similarity [Maudiozyma saulgeensis]|uniref:Uncharacterized protein n=1 Tax=Maudiozyma saulgeensis TaxID=1789683 RepID=A0A1X7R4P0_9SACH|nr:hypothetical protein, no similarity [Kazachstania saulgeensis]